MNGVVKALVAGIQALVHPIILVVLLVPMLVALAIWAGLSWAFWGAWTGIVQDLVGGHVSLGWIAHGDVAKLVSWLAVAIVLALLAPLVILTAVLIATVFAMPVLVRNVAQSDFPNLEWRRGGTAMGSLGNALAATAWFALLWIVTLPLWLLGPPAIVLPLLLSAYLNQRLFRYDALAEHADPAEMARIFERARGKLFALGLVTGLVYFIPPLTLIAPIFAALAFIHLCLDELQRLRAGQGRAGLRA